MSSQARKAYPSDLSDQQWELIEFLLCKPKKTGRPRTVDLREVVNAILYLARTGCQWDMIPNDLPKKSTVYDYFKAWHDDGTWQRLVDVLRGTVRQLESSSSHIEPSAASIDSQTVKTSQNADQRGYDGGKKITGRKRHIAVDTLGLLLAVVVTSAHIDDAAAAPAVLEQLKPSYHPRLEIIWADQKYHNNALDDWINRQRSIQWKLEIVRRPAGTRGFLLLPKRWVVERTFSWLGYWRRLNRDYERYNTSSECMVRIASIGRMLRRIVPDPKIPTFRYQVAA